METRIFLSLASTKQAVMSVMMPANARPCPAHRENCGFVDLGAGLGDEAITLWSKMQDLSKKLLTADGAASHDADGAMRHRRFTQALVDLPHRDAHQCRPLSQKSQNVVCHVDRKHLRHSSFYCEHCESRNTGESPTCQICGHVRAPSLMKSSFSYQPYVQGYMTRSDSSQSMHSTYSGASTLSRESTSSGNNTAEQPSLGKGRAAPRSNVCPSCHASDSINKGLCELCGFEASASSKVIHPVSSKMIHPVRPVSHI